MRILVTGSRLYDDTIQLRVALSDAIFPTVMDNPGEDVTLVVGDATGADARAVDFAQYLGLRIEVHAADWPRYGRGAGPIRNQEMVDSGADMALAFRIRGVPSHGTDDCVRRILAADIPLREFETVAVWSPPERDFES